jgi:para-nitrobenzyl esterase
VANKLDGDVENASPQALWEAWKAARAEEPMLKKLRHTQPSVDGITMSQTPGSALKQGKILDVPMLIGLTSQDMMPAFMYKMAIDFGITCDRLGHASVYGYFFDRVLPGNLYKAFHGSDLWYMFGNLDQSWRPFEAIDYALSKRMIYNVANFCKTGKPADDDWKPITRKHKGLRHFDGVDNGMVYPRFCKKKVWRSMLKEKGPI